MRLRKAPALLFIICAIAGGAFIALAWRPSIAAVAPPNARSFDAALVKRGAQLAAIGNCNTCHTAAGGRPFAGGTALSTPFGVIYATNITPEAETGIGQWSEAAFRRAMREGVDRGGRHLYPAFPYDHFTLMTEADITALYAYFMTREPVHVKAPVNEVSFPFNFRPLIAVWKLLFFSRRCLPARPGAKRGLEPRGLSGRRPRALRCLPHAAKQLRRRKGKRTLCRRRS